MYLVREGRAKSKSVHQAAKRNARVELDEHVRPSVSKEHNFRGAEGQPCFFGAAKGEDALKNVDEHDRLVVAVKSQA